MWAQLTDPNIVEKVRRSCRPEERDVLSRLIDDASRMPWASELAVVTSLGALRLTPQLTYEAGSDAGCVHLAFNRSGEVVVAYLPHGATASAAQMTRSPEDALAALELLLMHLFAEQQSHTTTVTTDTAFNESRLDIGARVRVILSERNRTQRAGTIERREWHHKLGRWTYYLADRGKAIKKRYFADDLEILP